MPPRMIASRAEGGNGGRVALAHPRVDGGTEVLGLAGEVLRAALDQPRPADVAGEPPRAPRRRQPVVVGGDHDLGVEPLGGAAQRRQRVVAGGAALEVVVVQHVELGGHRPAGEVAAPGGGGGEPRGGEERVRGGEPRRGRVDDDDDPAGSVVEAVLEPQPQVLERVEGPLRVGLVVALVPGDEAQRLGLDPGHRG